MSEEFKALCIVDEVDEIPGNEIDLSHLNKANSEAVRTMIASYRPSKNCTSPVEMKILLTDDSPVYDRPRRMSYTDRCIVDQQVAQWLKEGVIKPSTSNYASAIVLVSKRMGANGFAVTIVG